MKGLQNILFLNGNQSEHSYIAVGCLSELNIQEPFGAFQKLKAFRKKNSVNYIFGYLSYELKNDTENLFSDNTDWIGAPSLYFFVPEHIGKLENGEIRMLRGDKKIIEKVLFEFNDPNTYSSNIVLQPSLRKPAYLNKIKTLQNHIQLGDVYEANFCYSFEGQSNHFDALNFYKQLNKKSNAPFSVFGRLNNIEIASASPERFIKRTGDTLTSQPIKGTIKRGETKEEDQVLIQELSKSQKDRSENIMIVDLVRNDLSRIATRNSVSVDELCKIYTFDTLHQMVSTITAKIENEADPVDILSNTFPMGSMTGAPKVRAMELIEECENIQRGLYSGSVGYIAPNGDFDFNVIIRTLLHNRESGHLSVSVGGAITALSDPEQEYDETILKAEVLLKTLNTGI
ncbi:MAG: para-aminobenzoate synthetase component 1 [Flavobacteriales bacterium]